MKLEWKTCFKVGISVFVLYLCIYYWSGVSNFFAALLSAAIPLIAGGVIAYFINILLSFYERHCFRKTKSPVIIKLRRPICITLSLITLLAIISVVVGLVVPQLVSAVTLLISELPEAIKTAVDYLKTLEYVPEDILAVLESIDWKARINQVIDILSSGIGNVMNVVISTVSSVFSGIINTFLAIMFALYLLVSKDKLSSQLKRLMKCYLPQRIIEKTYYTVRILDDCFHKYIVGQCTEAVILGFLCTVGMLILGLPYATMIGALIAFTALIPVAGAYIGAVIGAFMIFTVSPLESLIFLIFLIILQQLEGNLIYPRVVGSSVGLPGIWVLAAVTVGGGIMGITGMLLSVPFTATVYRLIRDDLNRRTAVKKTENTDQH